MKITNPIKVILVTLILLLIVVLSMIGCLQPSTNQPTHLATKIIESLNETYGSIEGYKAEVQQIDIRSSTGNTGIASQCSQAQTQFRILFVKPDKLLIERDYSVEAFNGSTHWVYDKSKDEIRIEYINQTPDPFGFVVRELKNFEPRLVGEEKVNGEECYVLSFNFNFSSNSSTQRPIQLREVCIANESGRLYPVKIMMDVYLENRKLINHTELNSEKTKATVILKLRNFREINETDINKFNFSPPENVTKIFSYNYKIKKKVNQLTENEILDLCLPEGYRNWNHSLYDSTPYYRKNVSKDVTIYLEKSGSGFKAECHIEKNVSVKLTKLGIIKSPFVEDQEKIISIAKSKVNARANTRDNAINATPLFAYEIYNLATRKVEEYRIVMKDETRGYVVSVKDGKVRVRVIRLWFLKDLRPFNISIYNVTPLNQSPITLCAVMRYEGNLPRIIYYGGISPLAMLVFDYTRNVRMEEPLIKLDSLAIKVIEPGDELKRCFTFDLFKGKYDAIPYAEIALKDPLDCFKKYNDTDVAELKCYQRIYSHNIQKGSLSFKIEKVVGRTLNVFQLIAKGLI